MYSRLIDDIISTNIMKNVSTSLICTVLNEEKNIEKLIKSVALQSLKPSEFIIVDGGSMDSTVEIIKNCIQKYQRNLTIKLIIKKGNRSVGRNAGIREAQFPLILFTDSGCVLHKDWVINIIKPFKDKKVEVVAGYYKGKPENIFQKALVPFVLVMEDRINSENFLPATRSMALRISVWRNLNGFNEKLSHNEDYDFARRIRLAGYEISFKKDAIAYWIPRKNIFQSFKMFFRFAYGDIQANIFRVNVSFLFFRYILAIYLVSLIPIMKSISLNIFLAFCLILYISWTIWKNYKYVNNYQAVFYLPLLQFTADLAVLSGSIVSFFKHLKWVNILYFLKKNKSLLLISIFYLMVMLFQINWGIPNPSHPFNHFMDEWHQSQSIRNLFTVGSPNIPGSANGSIFQFFLTGIYLVPFYLLGIIDPFAIKSSVLNLPMQFKLFEILRLNTLLFGIASILFFYHICKKYFKFNPIVATFFFVFNPLWLMLSNYYKYDIALIFWVLVSFYFLIRYVRKPSLNDFLFASIFSGLSLATKLSTISFLPILCMTFVIFTPQFKKRIKWLIAGLILFTTAFISFGIPDIILGKGDLSEYLISNLSRTPTFESSRIIIDQNVFYFLLKDHYPVIFGHVLYLGFIFALALGTYILGMQIINNKKNFITLFDNFKENTVLVQCLILFGISLFPLKFGATNNRALILLPFMCIIFALGLEWVRNKIFFNFKPLFFLILIILVAIQVLESFAWINIKLNPDPRLLSSEWLFKNIPKESTIGIENIPIYQQLPDVIVKEYYSKQYSLRAVNSYKYSIVNSRSENFPRYVIMTNEEIESKTYKDSEKKQIVEKLKSKKYLKVVSFSPDLRLLKLFADDFNYYLSGLVQSPISIDIYEKR